MINRGTVVSVRKLKKFEGLYNNKSFLIIIISIVAGMIFGAVFYKQLSTFFGGIFSIILKIKENNSFLSISFYSLLIYFSVEIFSFICGTSVLGCVTVPCFSLCLGLISGGISSHLYNAFSLKGIVYNLLVISPGLILFIISYLFSCRIAFDFSITLSSLTFNKSSKSNLNRDFVTLTNHFLISLIISVFASVIDGLCAKLFSGFFSF